MLRSWRVYTFPYVLPVFERVLPKGVIANVSAAAVVFILALVILHMISNALARRVKDSSLSPIDRSLGLIFGLARGMILVCIAYIALDWMIPPGKAGRTGSPMRARCPISMPGRARCAPISRSRSHSSEPRRAAASAEAEADSAISALTNPSPNPAPAANAAPDYSPDEQRDLNRLIQQQNSK